MSLCKKLNLINILTAHSRTCSFRTMNALYYVIPKDVLSSFMKSKVKLQISTSVTVSRHFQYVTFIILAFLTNRK